MQNKIDHVMHQQQQQIVQNSKETGTCNSKQLFSIIYENSVYMVDPISLSRASLRFNEIIKPHVHDKNFMKTHHLEIHCNDFTKRNIYNFLNICQNLPNDVQDSEMKEICEIAKMFKANDIYKRGISFVNNSIDPNFSIPDYKYDSNEYIMTIESDNACNYSKNVLINSPQANLYNTQNNENDENNRSILMHKNVTDKELDKKKKKRSVIYSVQIEKRAFKATIYKFFFNNKLLYSATQKRNKIFIKEINDLCINENKDYIGYIIQNVADRSNTIKARDISFNLNYISSANPKQFLIDVSFPANNKIESWFPKPLKYGLEKDIYYRNFHGEYHRKPIMSSKNIVLQNNAGHPTFIVRKMNKNLYEFECNHNVDPLVAFMIGLSDVVGPYIDLLSTVNGAFY